MAIDKTPVGSARHGTAHAVVAPHKDSGKLSGLKLRETGITRSNRGPSPYVVQLKRSRIRLTRYWTCLPDCTFELYF